MRIELAFATAGQARRQRLEVPPGTTVGAALARSRFAGEKPAALAVYGEIVGPERVLEEGDRIDLLRPLRRSPIAARRDRAADVP